MREFGAHGAWALAAKPRSAPTEPPSVRRGQPHYRASRSHRRLNVTHDATPSHAPVPLPRRIVFPSPSSLPPPPPSSSAKAEDPRLSRKQERPWKHSRTPPAHGARGLAHENPRPQPHRARPVHRWPPPARKSLPPRAPRPRQNQAKPTPGATDVHAPSDTQTPPPRQPETGPSATPRGRQPPNRRSGQRALRPRRFGEASALAIQLNVRGMSAAIRSNKPRTSASVCPSFAAALRTCAAETGSRGSSPG